MKCKRCNHDFLHGEMVYDNCFEIYCEDCIEEVLVGLVRDDVETAAEKFGFDLCKFDARDESIYLWRKKHNVEKKMVHDL